VKPADPGGAALWTRGLVKSFGEQIALNGLDLAIPPGTFYSLLGPNGAGKSTLLHVLAGLTRPSGGEVRVLGKPPGRHNPHLRARVGLIAHRSQLYADLSAEENLRFFGALYGLPDREARVEEVLGRVELLHRRRDPVRAFSQGMTQRLAIARALLHDPTVLLLDEPTTGLDDRAVGILIELLSSLHDGARTLIMTTHRIDVGLRVGDRVGVLVSGRIVHEADPGEVGGEKFRTLYASLTGGGR
jgi:heme exporter protein A